jgi:hypothetical protein
MLSVRLGRIRAPKQMKAQSQCLWAEMNSAHVKDPT